MLHGNFSTNAISPVKHNLVQREIKKIKRLLCFLNNPHPMLQSIFSLLESKIYAYNTSTVNPHICRKFEKSKITQMSTYRKEVPLFQHRGVHTLKKVVTFIFLLAELKMIHVCIA